ncbi:MAG: HNH endonuclease [Syntrophales bacterium]
MDKDSALRLAAFDWLTRMTQLHGDMLPRKILEQGFVFEGERVPLISPQGIFKPRILDLPLTITTAPHGPYKDHSKDGILRYKYRGTDPDHRDNVGLRTLMKEGKPLIYFFGIGPGKYQAFWPVFLIGDDPSKRTFLATIDDPSLIYSDDTDPKVAEIRRAYITSNVKVRLHQKAFRENVLRAYRTQCALCKLRHEELLDAAHIIPDSKSSDVLKVSDGISLCKLHHAAYDSLILAINPDFVVKIREDVLAEIDGPMLQHGLKDLHRSKIILPRNRNNWPDRGLLEIRYGQFLNAA